MLASSDPPQLEQEQLLLLSVEKEQEQEAFPPPHLRGVPQPILTAKDYIIILFMLGLWAYSIFLILR